MYSSTPDNIRPGFTDADDNEMWRFLLKKLNEPDYGPARLPNGLVLWRDFIKQEPDSRLAQKTESNLASHFRKSMRGRIMDSNLTNDEIRFIFKALNWNMGKKEEAILKDRPESLKPRVFVNLRSPRKRSILLSKFDTSGFVDSDVEQETPKKKTRRQTYGKLSNEVFMKPNKFDDEDEIDDFLFNDDNQKKKKNLEKENSSPKANKEKDGNSSDTSSDDSLHHLGSRTASSRRQFRADSNISISSESSEEATPIYRRSKRLQTRKIKLEDSDASETPVSCNFIIESIALQHPQEPEDEEIREENTGIFKDVNENGTMNQVVKNMGLEETLVEEGTDNEKIKNNGALERRPPTIDLSTPVFEIDGDVNPEVTTEGNKSNQEAKIPEIQEDLNDSDVQVSENPVTSTPDRRVNKEIQVLEINDDTETPSEVKTHEFAPVTLACIRVAFHYANGDDVVLDDDALATAMKLEMSKSLDHYLRNLVQHFKNDSHANEKNPMTEVTSSVDSLPYYT